MKEKNIPFLDLAAQYRNIKPEIQAAIGEVLDSMALVQNRFCRQFAQEFLARHGGHFGVGCSNGTSALILALRALEIGSGDEVITVNNTFFATVEAIAAVGAKPVLVDCLPDTYGIDCSMVDRAVTTKTKAIIPVHLYGNPCNMDALCELARAHNLHIIEDCAQAHLATWKGQAVGTFGAAGTFSFYPGKNLGAYGDAGFVLTRDRQLLDTVTMHLNHGRMSKYEHQFMAENYRMDDIQGAVLRVKCQYLREWTDRRVSIAGQYDELLKVKGYKVIHVEPESECVYHLYIVETDKREEVVEIFKANNIGYGIHYPVPMSRQPACQELGYKRGSFPVSECIAERILSLPLYPEMTDEAVRRVAELL